MTIPLETIFALASGAGRAGIAVLRISGPRAGMALSSLTGVMPKPRTAHLCRLCDPQDGTLLDEALVLWFPAPNSFTGEDVVELHLHGGRAVIDGVAAVLGASEGLRLAEPGEFTKRAFLNGKMDLTAAEGLADLIEAETPAQRKQALRQSGGALAILYDGWAERLKQALAHFEAAIDFSDEDLPAGIEGAVRSDMVALAGEMAVHLDDGRGGERLRDGVHVAILGAPNVGKSSLLNRLAQRDAAIVSEMAGTTRDVIEVHLDLGGYPVILADTAGLRSTDDAIEAQGVARAHAQAERADLKVFVLDSQNLQAPNDLGLIDADTIVVANKVDLVPLAPGTVMAGYPVMGVSAQTEEGLSALVDTISQKIGHSQENTEAPQLTRQRHREAVTHAYDCLVRFGQITQTDLAAEDLRLALRAMGRLTGRVDVEDLLDVIFRDFCIGK